MQSRFRISGFGFRLFLVGVLCAVCGAFYSPVHAGILSREQEISLGRRVARQLELQYGVWRDPHDNARLLRIASKVVQFSHRKDVPYSFKILATKDVNALALPGGPVYVFKGLMDITNDDELAYVLGHEIAHVARKHTVRIIEKAYSASLILGIIGLVTDTNPGIFGDILATLFVRGYSREYESEADRIGITYSFQAGYDPQGAILMLEKFQKMSGNTPKPFSYFQTHPNPKDRIKNIRKQIPKLYLEFGHRQPAAEPLSLLILPLPYVGQSGGMDVNESVTSLLAGHLGNTGRFIVQVHNPVPSSLDLNDRDSVLHFARSEDADFVLLPSFSENAFTIETKDGKTKVKVKGKLNGRLLSVKTGEEAGNWEFGLKETKKEVKQSEVSELLNKVLSEPAQKLALEVIGKTLVPPEEKPTKEAEKPKS